MSKDKQTKQESQEVAQEEVKKEKKETPKKTEGKLHIAKLFYGYCEEGLVFPDGVPGVVEMLWNKFQEVGQTKNIRGNLITKENLTSQVKAIMFDIKARRPGVWSTYQFTETEKEGLQLGTA